MRKFLSYLAVIVLCVLCMAPNRRPHDHIGNFNFKVEIEGVTQGAIRMATSEAVACSVEDSKGEVQELTLRVSADQKVPTKFDTVNLKGNDGKTLVLTDVKLASSAIKGAERHLVLTYGSCELDTSTL